jgi:RNA polymerase sigma-70 factor (ECF subfamily)
MGADDAQAEDVAQEVMLRLWQMHESLEENRLGNMASIMARNLTIDQQRSVHAVSIEEEHVSRFVDTSEPMQRLEESENEEWLRQKLKQLPRTQQTILHFRQVERLTHREIAERLGLQETSISTLLARARKSLLEEIKKKQRQ